MISNLEPTAGKGASPSYQLKVVLLKLFAASNPPPPSRWKKTNEAEKRRVMQEGSNHSTLRRANENR